MSIEIIIAILSLLISLFTSIRQKRETDRLNQINLESQIYMDVFKEFMIEKLPRARNYIYIDKEGRLKDCKELSSELIALKNASLYFSYRNKFFYDKLKDKITELDEYMVKKRIVF